MSENIEIKYDEQSESTEKVVETEAEETVIDIIGIEPAEYGSEEADGFPEREEITADNAEGSSEEDESDNEEFGPSDNITDISEDSTYDTRPERTQGARRRNDGGLAATAAASQELNLKASIARHTIHHGQIFSIEDNTIYNGAATASAVIITQSLSKIVIPFEEFWADTNAIIDKGTVDFGTEDGRRRYLARQRQVLSRLLGTSIDFIIKSSEKTGSENETYYIGSRKDANNRIMSRYFFTEPQRYTIGETYTGTVLSVNRNTLALSWNGIDIPLSKYAITERYADDLNSLYQPGDKIEFKLLEVNKDDGKFGLKVDVKGVELEKARSLHHLLSTNSVASGTITRIFKTSEGRITVYAALDGLPIPCTMKGIKPSDFGMEFKKGDKVQIIIQDFYKSGYVGGICKRLDSGMPVSPGSSFANY